MKQHLTMQAMMTMPDVKTPPVVTEDTAVLEVVIYKVKLQYADDFREILDEARATIQSFPGIIEYQTFRSTSNELLFMDIVRWETLALAKNAAKEVEQMQELAPFIAVFEEIIMMDHFDPFADKGQEVPLADLLQLKNEYYKASERPQLVEFPAYHYLSIKGVSAPEDQRFLNAVEAIYEVIYNLKFTSKASGRNFIIDEMEAQWWVESGLPFDQTPREEWHWNILIRVPEFITPDQVDLAVQEVIKLKNVVLASEVEFATITAGKFVQALHVGSYEAETPTIEKIMQFIDENNLEVTGHHHEIYLTDPRKVPVEKLRTILRYAVK
ncbi:hypothetical protein C900_00482 [Fulvivirga imtechensis AK7]|uniref:GyrI-like small molecule binding domain-containing protein n=1 Tax=Fulvivirga imtechensis AK7 TaxID=1237149 RepID=L8JW04_9BACT|nr:GyrI-like domain-containing protein [Fulvivirga imtechensis]ELR72980.1 hypothetical protein C900_00482 [Fulvivirga imtechensis AK7]